jgi:hypothetical protein
MQIIFNYPPNKNSLIYLIRNNFDLKLKIYHNIEKLKIIELIV